jgi:short subunit fatty acids transporter
MKTFKLENEPKIETGFKTPDHYFENFSIKMMEQLPKNEPKVISIFQKRKTLIMMAAAILVIALMIPILSPSSTNTKELDAAALENYITYQSNVNQYDLISVLETEDINNIKTGIVLEDDAIEDHLSTNSNLENLILE